MPDITKHPVIELIKKRAKEGSKPGKRKDTFKVGLIVEGGALRGVVSAAELRALQLMGFRDSFDVIYGESVGAGNAAWFMSLQIDKAIAVYWTLINNHAFLNPLRLLLGRSLMDNDFLNQQVEEHFPISFDEFKASGIILNVLAARVDKPKNQKGVYEPEIVISDFPNKDTLISALRGGIQEPFISGDPYPFAGMELWDVGILDKLPVQKAINDGCTHILTATCCPIDYQPVKQHAFTVPIVRAYINTYSSELADHYIRTAERYRETLDFLRQKQLDYKREPFVAMLALPRGTKRLSDFEIRAHVLQEEAKLAEENTRRVFLD